MKRISLFLQFIVITFAISAIPAVLIIYINTQSMQNSMEQAVAESALNKIRANQELGDEMLLNIIYDGLDLILAKQYAGLNGVTSYDVLNSDYDYVKTVLSMKNSFTDLAERNKLVHSVFYYMDGADYVVATDGGFVKLDDYYDMRPIQEALEQIRGAEGIWLPRSLTTEENGKSENVHLVSYIYRASNLYTSVKGTIVINIYEEELCNLIYSNVENAYGNGFLVTGKGDVVAHSDWQYLYTNIRSQEPVERILNTKDISGYGITDDREYLYTFQKSALYDWIYINEYSLEDIFAQSRKIVGTGTWMMFFVTLAGAICAVIISSRIYKPIRKLTDEVKGQALLDEDGGKNRNEIILLSGAFGQMREREKNLKDSLSKSEDSVRQMAVGNLIHGESIQEKERKLLEETFRYNHFLVCILAIDGFQAYQQTTGHDERKHHRFLLHSYIKEAFPEGYLADSARYNVSSIAMVVNIEEYDSDKVNQVVSESLNRLKEYFNAETGQNLSAGVSRVHSSLDSVKRCTEEAWEAVKRRLVQGKGHILFYQKDYETSTNTYDVYQHEKRLLNYLELGNLEKIDEELSFMIGNIRGLEKISVENVMLVFNQLLGTIIMYMNKNNYSASVVLGGQSNLFLTLTELETMDEIKTFLWNVFEKIVAYQTEDIQEHDNLKLIMNYIRKNYKKDILFDDLAEEVGISYSYIRKILKESTGKSLLDNLNMVRIDEAKLLLERSDLSISEIAATVGYYNIQSFYRFFKKFEGISPKEYQDANAEVK